MNSLLKHLGKLGTELPELTEKHWESIFNFISWFLTTESKDVDFNFKKLMEVLILINKVK
jgi:hypothetical protein